MKQIFKNQFLTAVIAYLLIVGLITVFVFSFLQKLKSANLTEQEKLSVYQNLQIKDQRFTGSFKKIACDGNLFFQAGAPITAIYISQGRLFLSQTDNKLTVIDLIAPGRPTRSTLPVLTDIYSDGTDIYGTDFFNDKVVKLIFKKDEFIVEKYYPKIGRASAITKDSKGYFYVSGYASGNTTKIIGRDGFLFLSDLDNIVDLEASGSSQLLAARYGSEPALINIDLNDKKQTIIEKEKSISSLSFDGDFVWVAYNQDGQSQIGKVIGEKLVNIQALNCPFPLKIAASPEKFFYTSLNDSEGKVYWINKNLQSSGI